MMDSQYVCERLCGPFKNILFYLDDGVNQYNYKSLKGFHIS